MNVATAAKVAWPIVNPAVKEKPGLCSPGWKYNASQQTLHRLNCKRRTCDTCGWYWTWQWRTALDAKTKADTALKIPKAKLALTLTMAEYADYKTVWNTFRYFWQLVRKSYPFIQYCGFVEENQQHTLPHFHFIITNVDFISHNFLREKWITAQNWAGIGKTAWILRVERIKKNITAYFTKYITKAKDGKKDELPRKENWKGRYVRYSRYFFGEVPATNGAKTRKAVSRKALVEAISLQEKLDAEEQLDRLFYRVRKPLAGVSGFMEESDRQAAKLDALVNATWSPYWDKGRAGPAPPETLLDAAGIGTLTTYVNKFEPDKKKPSIEELKELHQFLRDEGRKKVFGCQK